ncbi:MAG: hypothetical protein JNJ77_08745 [Planctomycetia bacterium]|nr:hypothetical protein [Planctomycetia bacterium]
MFRYLSMLIILTAGCSSGYLTQPVKVPTKTRPFSTLIGSQSARSGRVTPYVRSELESMLLGKTEIEVVGKLGNPNRKTEKTWVYSDPSKDLKSGKVTYSFSLHWNSGKVEKITYE